MSGNVVIVLHAPADVALAEEIARELSPFAAFAMGLSEARPMRIGAGAVGVIVWTASIACLDLGVLPADAVICMADRTTPPAEGRAIRTVPGGAYGEALRAQVSAVQAARVQARSRAGFGGDDALTASAAFSARSSGNRLAVRSTTGLAAALAVVGIATPLVSGARVSEDASAQDVGLSLVGEARAATNEIRPASLQPIAARPSIEPAMSMPSLDSNEAVLTMLEALDSAPRRPIPSSRGAIEPALAVNLAPVEVLSSGQVVTATDLAAFEVATDSATDSVTEPASYAGGAVFWSETGAEPSIQKASFNSYHRMIGPLD